MMGNSLAVFKIESSIDHIISGDGEIEPFWWLGYMALVLRECTNEHAETTGSQS
jgi:hypothetical protein